MSLWQCHRVIGEAVVKDSPGAIPAAVAFDVNDLSILFPSHDGVLYPDVPLDAASLTALGVRDLWPQTAFQPMLDFASGKDAAGDTAFLADLVAPSNAQAPGQFGLSEGIDSSFLPEHRKIGVFVRDGVEQDDPKAQIKLNPTFTDRSRWRIVSLRVDPCAQAAGSNCNVEMRLIAQPVGGNAGAPVHALDRSAHLLYHLGKLDQAKARLDPTLPRAGLAHSFRDLVVDLQHIKALAGAAGGSTDGRPLGAHPGLIAEWSKSGAQKQNGPLAQAILKLIQDYTAGGLSAVTSMQMVHDPSPWVFFQGSVVAGVWHPIGITGNNQQFSIRFEPQGTGFIPEPLTSPNASGLFSNDGDSPGLNADNAAVAYRIDNPGRYGVQDVLPKVSVVSTDCLSCHTTLARLSSDQAIGSAANVPGNLRAMYIPTPGITAYPAPGSAAPFIWDFRAFGVYGALTSPVVTSRVLNETAEAVRFLDEDLLPQMVGSTVVKHGFTCYDAAGTGHALLHARMWDCTVVQKGDFDQCRAVICSGSGP